MGPHSFLEIDFGIPYPKNEVRLARKLLEVLPVKFTEVYGGKTGRKNIKNIEGVLKFYKSELKSAGEARPYLSVSMNFKGWPMNLNLHHFPQHLQEIPDTPGIDVSLQCITKVWRKAPVKIKLGVNKMIAKLSKILNPYFQEGNSEYGARSAGLIDDNGFIIRRRPK